MKTHLAASAGVVAAMLGCSGPTKTLPPRPTPAEVSAPAGGQASAATETAAPADEGRANLTSIAIRATVAAPKGSAYTALKSDEIYVDGVTIQWGNGLCLEVIDQVVDFAAIKKEQKEQATWNAPNVVKFHVDDGSVLISELEDNKGWLLDAAIQLGERRVLCRSARNETGGTWGELRPFSREQVDAMLEVCRSLRQPKGDLDATVRIEPWQLELRALPGTTLKKIHESDGLGTRAELAVPIGCAPEIIVVQRDASELDEQSDSGPPEEREERVIDEVSKTGFRQLHHDGTGWWSASVGRVIGEDLYVCTTLNPLTQGQGRCVLEVCDTLRRPR